MPTVGVLKKSCQMSRSSRKIYHLSKRHYVDTQLDIRHKTILCQRHSTICKTVWGDVWVTLDLNEFVARSLIMCWHADKFCFLS